MTDLPQGWETVRLDEIAEVRLGRQRSPKNHVGSNMRPYVRAANVGWGGLKLADVKEMQFTEAEVEVYRLLPGDVLCSEASGSASEVGKAALWSGEIEDCCFQNTLIRVRSRGVASRFLHRLLWFEAYRGSFADNSRGVGIHHLGATRIAGWLVDLPPLAEQRRIVDALDDHLSRLDAATELLEAAHRRIVSARLGVMRLAGLGVLGSNLTTAEHAEIPDAGTHDDALPGLPHGWRWARLGEVAEVVGGVTKDANKQSDPTYVETPYLRVANVLRGRLDLGKITTLRVPPAKASALALQPGDLLLNEGGDRDKLGRGWIWEGQIPGCIHQNHVFRARLHEGVYVDPRLLGWYTNTYGQAWCERNGKQSVNLASISLSKIRLLPVPVPPHEAQRRTIADADAAFESFDRLESATTIAAARAKSLRRSLLDAAFSGRLVPQDPADEPAAQLLARIAAERPTSPRRRASSRSAKP